MDESTRRQFVITGLAALGLAGCQPANNTANAPSLSWPPIGTRPTEPPIVGPGPIPPSPPTVIEPPPSHLGTAATPIARKYWSRGTPNMRDINPMNGITRITLHHEGSKPVTFTDLRSTAERMDQVRDAHRARGWADIGYHFVIDRAGRVWEGRDLRYQGAHVRDDNEHNLGIMVLGNFDQQAPSDAQLAALRDTVRYMRQKFKVSPMNIRTHREMPRAHTECPGRMLQPRIDAMRSQRMFV